MKVSAASRPGIPWRRTSRYRAAGVALTVLTFAGAYGCHSKPEGELPSIDPVSSASQVPAGKMPDHQELTPIGITPEDVADAVTSLAGDYELRMEAAAYYLQHGLYPRAITDLKAAVALRPHSLTASIALADAESLGGQTAQAAETYSRVLRLSPSNALAYRGLGQVRVREGNLKEARRVLEEGLHKNPDSAEIRIALGNLYLVMQKNDLAKTTLLPAVKKSPRDADAHYLLGLAYERDRHIKAALREAQTAVSLDPTLVQAWGSIGLYQVKLEHYHDARAPLLSAIRLNPHEPRYYQLLGDSYVKDLSPESDPQRGIDLYRKGLAQNPNDVRTLIALATALTDRGLPADRTSAVPLLKRVIKLRPDDQEPYYRLAQVYRQMGHSAEADVLLARFQTLAKSAERQRHPSAAGGDSNTARQPVSRSQPLEQSARLRGR